MSFDEIAELKYNGKFEEGFLIDCLQVFYEEYGRSPLSYEMRYIDKNLVSHEFNKVFGSWNNALKAAGLKINHYQPKLDGTETCSNCGGKRLGRSWHYRDNERLCKSCHDGANFKYGELSPTSQLGIHFISTLIIQKYFNIEIKCNRGEKFDYTNMFNFKDKNYRLNTSKYSQSRNNWYFKYRESEDIDNFIFIGFSENHEDIEHVWIIPANNKRIKNSKILSVTNSEFALSKIKKFEVDTDKFNEIYHSLNFSKCSIIKSE